MACCLSWKQDLGWNANFLIRLLLLFTNKRRWFSSQIRPRNAPRPMPSLRKTKYSIICIKILWMAKCQNSWVENVCFYSQITAVSWWKITVKLSKYGALIAIFSSQWRVYRERLTLENWLTFHVTVNYIQFFTWFSLPFVAIRATR